MAASEGVASPILEALRWGQFAGLALAWGSSFALTTIALETVTPPQLVWFRLMLGALVLTAIVIVRKTRLPRNRSTLLHLIVVSVASCLFPFLLFAFAQQHIVSSVASVFLALTPLMSVIGAFAFNLQRPSRSHTAAVVLGLLGVALLLLGSGGASSSETIWGIIACFMAAVSYGFNYGYVRRFLSHSGYDQLALASTTVTISAVVMLLATPFVFHGGFEIRELGTELLLCFLALGPVGTGVAYIWSFSLIRDWGPVRASYVSYLIPMVGILLGTIFMHERLDGNEVVGMGVIVTGMLIIGLASRRRPILRRERSG